MVGIFSRFSVLSSHRRTPSVQDRREELPPTSEVSAGTALISSASAIAHGIEIAVEFKPVEQPSEPFDNDEPIQCPLPEPSILNDGRIWKERVSSGVQKRADIQKRADMPPVVQDQPPETHSRKPRPQNRVILPSASAPEHNILKMLDEYNTSSI